MTAPRPPAAAAPDAIAAWVQQALGRTEAARAAYEQAVALLPRHAGAFNNLGTLFTQQGRWAEAEQAFGRARAFAAGRFARHLETAFEGMVARWRAGEPPADMTVDGSAGPAPASGGGAQ